MSFEHDAHHFTLSLDVLRAFVSVSELIFKKNAKFPYAIQANEPQKFHHSDVVKHTSSAKTTRNAFERCNMLLDLI